MKMLFFASLKPASQAAFCGTSISSCPGAADSNIVSQCGVDRAEVRAYCHADAD